MPEFADECFEQGVSGKVPGACNCLNITRGTGNWALLLPTVNSGEGRPLARSVSKTFIV